MRASALLALAVALQIFLAMPGQATTTPIKPRQFGLGSTPVADPDASVPLDRLLIALPPNASDELKSQAMTLAQNIEKRAKTCADLPGISSLIPGTIYTRL